MLYLKCPTCNRLLGDKEVTFLSKVNEINSNPKLTDEEKVAEKEKLLDFLKVPKDNYCCRMRLMTFTNLIEIVK